MARLSRVHEWARQEILHLAGAAVGPAEFSRRLLVVLERAIQSDGQTFFGVDPGTLLFNRVLAVSAGMVPHTLWYLRTHYLAEPVAALDHPELMRAGHQALALRDRPETSWAAPPHLVSAIATRDWHHMYHERQGPAGGVVRAYFAAEGRWLAGLVLARFEARRPFQSADVAFIHLVAPSIGRALRAALERERAIATALPNTLGASGVLVLAPDGREKLITPVAEGWLRVLRDSEASFESRLPSAVWSAVAASRAQLDASIPPVVRIATPAGFIRIEASTAEDGSLAIVLAPEHRQAPPDVPEDWPLTRQERQVLRQVLRGLTNRQIAATLVISENTVESHLAHVFAKLEVRSRSQLLSRLFREAYLPAIEEPPP